MSMSFPPPTAPGDIRSVNNLFLVFMLIAAIPFIAGLFVGMSWLWAPVYFGPVVLVYVTCRF